MSKVFNQAKIYVAVILLQFGFSGFAIIAQFALNQGTSHYTFAVYRNAIAAVVFAPFAIVIERKIRPEMTFNVFFKIMLLGLLDPVIGQNLFFAGMNQTSATFTSAISNVIPAIVFIMAWILRVEKVNIRKLHSQSKILGTIVTVGGAMIITLVAGPVIGLPWTRAHSDAPPTPEEAQRSPIRGALMIIAGNTGYALFYILQVVTLKSYPAGLSLTSMLCASGALQGTILTFIVERGNLAIWSIGLNSRLLAYAYGGIIGSGVTYYISGVIMEKKGPVFVTAFTPLSMVITAILSSFIFQDQLVLGQIVGAAVIVAGLYLVIWGSSKSQSESTNVGSEIPLHQQQTLETKTSLDPNDVPKTISEKRLNHQSTFARVELPTSNQLYKRSVSIL